MRISDWSSDVCSSDLSLLECVDLVAEASGGKRPNLTYDEQARVGDHICYYTDMAKFREHYPAWQQRHSLDAIVEEMVGAVAAQQSCPGAADAADARQTVLRRSDERSVGKECGSTCRSWWSP